MPDALARSSRIPTDSGGELWTRAVADNLRTNTEIEKDKTIININKLN